MKNFNINSILITIVLVIFMVLSGLKVWSNYEQSHDTWMIKTLNHSFAIVVTPGEDDEVLVRNPIPDLKPGDTVVVKGFTLDSNFPYIESKIK